MDLEHTVTDVVEGKEYLFSVTACNKCGPGEPAYIDEPVNVSSPASQCPSSVHHSPSTHSWECLHTLPPLLLQLFLSLLRT